MSGAEVMAQVLAAKSPEAAVKVLSRKRFRKMLSHLLPIHEENESSRRVMGILLGEGTARYLEGSRK